MYIYSWKDLKNTSQIVNFLTIGVGQWPEDLEIGQGARYSLMVVGYDEEWFVIAKYGFAGQQRIGG
jgi:hypothetical protein